VFYSLWAIGSWVHDAVYYDDRPIIQIEQYHPDEITVVSGNSFYVNYLYRKRDCSGTITYIFQTVEDGEIVEQHNLGPYVAAWPSSDEPRWIRQHVPVNYLDLEPGEYDFYWQITGRCVNSETERPASSTLVNASPVTRINLIEPVNE